MQSLAIKYRPKSWDDVVEQDFTKVILRQQLQSGEWKHAYLFCGGAGTGKTTCARIFAKELNHGQGNPIELDAASNNSVEDVREIIKQAKTKSLNSDYKVFIIDECHALSNSAWQAMLKLIEEPPATSIFLFCTTDPQKIPATIISRVQRYDFQRISRQGIIEQLCKILAAENIKDTAGTHYAAVEYISKIADGGMRDAITLLDKCLSYTTDLNVSKVVDILGTVDYETMFRLTDCLQAKQDSAKLDAVKIIEDVYNSGKDVKVFVRQYVLFLLDCAKYAVGCNWQYLQLPAIEEYELHIKRYEKTFIRHWLDIFVVVQNQIKWSTTAKWDIECAILLEEVRQ